MCIYSKVNAMDVIKISDTKTPNRLQCEYCKFAYSCPRRGVKCVRLWKNTDQMLCSYCIKLWEGRNEMKDEIKSLCPTCHKNAELRGSCRECQPNPDAQHKQYYCDDRIKHENYLNKTKNSFRSLKYRIKNQHLDEIVQCLDCKHTIVLPLFLPGHVGNTQHSRIRRFHRGENLDGTKFTDESMCAMLQKKEANVKK